MYNDETQSSSHNRIIYTGIFNMLNTVLSAYKGLEPFHYYIKKYFALNKKHGSRDRKIISSLCYNYFRLGNGVAIELNFRQKILLSIFLCEKDPSNILEFFKPGLEWINSATLK